MMKKKRFNAYFDGDADFFHTFRDKKKKEIEEKSR